MSDAAEKLGKLGITMDVKYGESKPRPPGMGSDMSGYTVRLKWHGRSMTTDFFTGSGWDRSPDVADVLSSLVLDAAGSVLSFDEFCDEFGYDIDSREAEKTWKAVKSNGTKTRKFLGAGFDEVANAVQDY